jgi:hypothetical protein
MVAAALVAGACISKTVEKCLREKGYYPWADRNQYDRARETVPTF